MSAPKRGYTPEQLVRKAATQAKWDAAHKEHKQRQNKAWKAANPERVKAIVKRYYASHPEMVRARRVRKYGLTYEQFAGMVSAQNGACLICREVPPDVLRVDHCHATGRIRGLLCRHCNTGIGMLKDSPVLVASALEYLQCR